MIAGVEGFRPSPDDPTHSDGLLKRQQVLAANRKGAKTHKTSSRDKETSEAAQIALTKVDSHKNHFWLATQEGIKYVQQWLSAYVLRRTTESRDRFGNPLAQPIPHTIVNSWVSLSAEEADKIAELKQKFDGEGQVSKDEEEEAGANAGEGTEEQGGESSKQGGRKTR